MSYGLLTFTQLPTVGFAHHFYTEQYHQNHKTLNKSLEIAYVKEGTFTAEIGGKSYTVQPGSVLVLVRTRPFRLYARTGMPQSHCSIQLVFDFDCKFVDKYTDVPADFSGLVLPPVLPPGALAEQIKKELFALVTEVSARRENPPLSASLTGLSVLMRIDQLFRNGNEHSGSLYEYKIKRYIAEHIHQRITLKELGEALDRTPNHLNSVFCSATGQSIRQYINGERVRLMGELMTMKGLPFKAACESVAIDDVSYGYRLFKQHMGITVRAYLQEQENINAERL